MHRRQSTAVDLQVTVDLLAAMTRRFGLRSVPGYLVAGVVIGPVLSLVGAQT